MRVLPCTDRAAKVRFSPVLCLLIQNLEPNVNLRSSLYRTSNQNRQNRFYKVRSEVRTGSNLRTKVKIALTAHITVSASKGRFLYVHQSLSTGANDFRSCTATSSSTFIN